MVVNSLRSIPQGRLNDSWSVRLGTFFIGPIAPDFKSFFAISLASRAVSLGLLGFSTGDGSGSGRGVFCTCSAFFCQQLIKRRVRKANDHGDERGGAGGAQRRITFFRNFWYLFCNISSSSVKFVGKCKYTIFRAVTGEPPPQKNTYASPGTNRTVRRSYDEPERHVGTTGRDDITRISQKCRRLNGGNGRRAHGGGVVVELTDPSPRRYSVIRNKHARDVYHPTCRMWPVDGVRKSVFRNPYDRL